MTPCGGIFLRTSLEHIDPGNRTQKKFRIQTYIFYFLEPIEKKSPPKKLIRVTQQVQLKKSSRLRRILEYEYEYII